MQGVAPQADSNRTAVQQQHLFAGEPVPADPDIAPELERVADFARDRILGLVKNTVHLRALGAAVRHAVALMALKTAPIRGFATIVRPDGGLRLEPVRSGLFIELSPRYLAAAAGVAIGTARDALDLLAPAIGELRVAPLAASLLGVDLRTRRAGRLWGTHRIFAPEFVVGIRRAARILQIEGILPSRPVGFSPRPVEELRAAGFVSMPTGKVRGSGIENLRCPFHTDERPSMSAFRNAHGQSGGAVCHACFGADGKPMTAFWARASDGTRWMRPSVRSEPEAPASSPPAPPHRPSIRSPQISGVPTPEPQTPRWLPAAIGPSLRSRPRPLEVYSLDGPEYGEAIRDPAYILGALSGSGLRPSYASGDPLHALRWAERNGPAAERAAWAASMSWAKQEIETREALADRLLSVSVMRATRHDHRRLPGGPAGRDRMRRAVPTRVEAVEQEWILVDIDDLDPALAPAEGWPRLVRAVRAALAGDAMLSGRIGVVRTSPTGLQVWVGLAKRYAAAEFHAHAAIKAWYRRVATAILVAIRAAGLSGGHVDRSAFAPGRYGRRPGWRLLENGVPFRARLIYATE